jgi:transcriptional regulator with XRE-family HTH domain
MSATSTGRKVPNVIDVHIGQKIRARRLHLGMSQEKLADALGLTFQQVQKYEKGVNRLGGSRLQQISDALGVSPSHFFNGAPTVGKKAASPNEGELSQLEINSFLATRDGALLVRSQAGKIGDYEIVPIPDHVEPEEKAKFSGVPVL